jgi:hypothetical protein
MKPHVVLSVVILVFLSACQAEVCPPESVTYVSDPVQFLSLDSAADNGPSPSPILVEIGGKMVEVDRVIHGPLCNDTWSGTIYVACDVQIVEWTEEQGPFFFDNCGLIIEPGTVVYVAAHNNTAYYNGCAVCHTSEGSQ